MQQSITIIYPFRDRDYKRIATSLESLNRQTIKGFNVSFIDYGSTPEFSEPVKQLVNTFDFATYTYLGHQGLLWNKSKALNYGIRNSKSDYILTSDVDIIFKENFIETVIKHASQESFLLFKIGYLSKAVTDRQQSKLDLNGVEIAFEGETFGIGLFPNSNLQNIHGLDEFFHFYGSEDEDLNARLTASGTHCKLINELLLYHQWHPRYPQKIDKQLTKFPRLSNILRLNQRHYLLNKESQKTKANLDHWGVCYATDTIQVFESPDISYDLVNIKSHVEHLLGVELSNYTSGVVSISITEDAFYKSLKFRLKHFLGKVTQPYLSMKEVNDLILKEILFKYRNFNYYYMISEDLNKIKFMVDFNSLPKA